MKQLTKTNALATAGAFVVAGGAALAADRLGMALALAGTGLAVAGLTHLLSRKRRR